VINAAGPWVNEWLQSQDKPPFGSLFHASKAFNLVTRRLPFADAVGFAAPRSTYFVIPWNGHSLVGTRHVRCAPDERSATVTAEEVQEFLNDINGRLGALRVSHADVTGVFCGLLPERPDTNGRDVELDKSARVIEHSARDGLVGVYSIVGIKWTTARSVAERAVTQVCKRLQRPPRSAGPRTVGPTAPSAATVTRARALGLGSAAIEHLTEMYGGTFEPILDLVARTPSLAEPVTDDSPVLRAEVVHAMRDEMACRLTDVVRRRTPLYLSDGVDARALHICASLMGAALGWSSAERALQIEDAARELQAFHFYTPAHTGSNDNLRRLCS
jgi:glycerol-3-phosphate dehydrogenase